MICMCLGNTYIKGSNINIVCELIWIACNYSMLSSVYCKKRKYTIQTLI